MAQHTTKITITHRDDQVPKATMLSLDKRMFLVHLAAACEGMAQGAISGTVEVYRDDGDADTATGSVTFDGASDTTTVTINGVAFSQTTGDDDSRSLELAEDINASGNALVSGQVEATIEVSGTVIITAKQAGAAGNLNTLAASGTGVTVSGNRLTGGANATANTARF